MMTQFENSTQKAQREGRESRAQVVAFLADTLTSSDNPLTVGQLDELRYLQFYFTDLSKPIADVVRRYADRPDLRDAVLLAAAVQLVELLIDPAPGSETAQAPSQMLRLASGTSVKVGSVFPKS
jgi:hypothetical protein